MHDNEPGERGQLTSIAWGICLFSVAIVLFYYAYLYLSTGSTYCYLDALVSNYYRWLFFNPLWGGTCHLFEGQVSEAEKPAVGAAFLAIVGAAGLFFAIRMFSSNGCNIFRSREDQELPKRKKGNLLKKK